MNSLNKNKILAIIFDFDGVIVNSEPLWFKAAKLSLIEMNLKYDDKITYKNTIGMISENVWKILLKSDLDTNQKKKLNLIYRLKLHLLFDKELKLTTGIISFLKKNELPIKIVSNASKKYINETLNRFNIKNFRKKDIISCSGKLNPKPMPDGYLKAVNDLNVPINNILVIEDSDVGIEAAKSAKIKTIIRYTHNNENLPSQTKYQVPILMSFNYLKKMLLDE
jgi:beta-phosphoglucomutase|tara:strand:+ start:670 stop:1338 length:669 start_codon:yes stop_codon:yes gene_type:complete